MFRRILSWTVPIILLALLTINIIPSPMLKLFRREVQQELKNHPALQQGKFSEAELASLPEPVKRYFKVCGWIGKPKMSNTAIHITDMQLKMDLEKDFVRVRSYQFNSVAEPVRIAYMRATMYGVIPFSGRDKYQNGAGHMYIKVMNLITAVDSKGPEMDKSALVTVLAETFLAPSYALQPYISWEPVDARTAKATLTFNDTSVSGTFHFNAEGELERFETADRYMSQKDGSQKRSKWLVSYGNYQERNGVRIATEMSAYWEIDGRLKQYAKMRIAEARYDVRSVEEVMFSE